MAACIMVANDDANVLVMCKELLEEQGYRVKMQYARMHDLTVFKEVKPDLLVIDQMFGGDFTGWQLIQKMKLNKTTQAIPIILSTAMLSIVRKIEAHLIAKNVRVLIKPCAMDEVLAAVHAALDYRPPSEMNQH